MTKQQLIAAVRAARDVYATVKLTEHDMFWVKAVKKDVITTLQRCDVENWNDDEFNAWIHADGTVYLG